MTSLLHALAASAQSRYNASTLYSMADWKQITARIRRAKGSKDPAGQLSNLFQKTRDAMVAFELARYLESASKPEEAAKWYALSWQRFRRGDWKTKAQDAVTRLGGALPAQGEVLAVPEIPRLETQESQPSAAPESSRSAGEAQQTGALAESTTPSAAVSSESAAPQTDASPSSKGNRRRGRRGGRNRRKGSSVSATSSAFAAQASSSSVPTHTEIAPPRVVDSRAIPRVPVETAPDSSPAVSAGLKGRFGDPGLSSRLSFLEMQFRRLLTCPPTKLDQTDRAPAGPGVFVLTDEELTTYYYVEACDSLRVAIGNVSRGGGTRRSGISIKPLLADHLGIPEARVAKYLSEHCVVRWLQLDEGAEYFAHFVIAILRPVLNAKS